MRRALAILFLCWAALSSAQTPQPKTEAAKAQSAQNVAAASNQVAPPVRVEIVNQATEPGGYHDPCRYDQGDSRSDLCAQWTAANAARDAAYYARLQLWGAAAGIIGLLITIWLTRRAVKAAQDSVRVAQDTAKRQLRAYLVAQNFRLTGFVADQVPMLTFRLKNTGQTPASELRERYEIFYRSGPFHEMESQPVRFSRPYKPSRRGTIIGAGEAITYRCVFDAAVTAENVEDVRNGKFVMFVAGAFSYRDTFGRRRILTMHMVLPPFRLKDDGRGRLGSCERGNKAN